MMKTVKRIVLAILLFIGMGACILLYALVIEPNRLVTETYTLGEEKKGETLIRAVQIADIQVGENYSLSQLEKVVKRVNQQNPDLILFTGDLFDNFSVYGPTEEVTEALKNLNAKYGKYAVWGNRDYGGGASRVYEEIMEESGFHLLTNETSEIILETGEKITITGLDDFLLGNPLTEEVLEQVPKDSSYRLFLIHEPDPADLLAGSAADLILAGHSHGGQVKLPFMEVITNTLSEKYTEGFYTLQESPQQQLYVNTGIGTSHIPIRFMVPPQIAVFDIYIEQ